MTTGIPAAFARFTTILKADRSDGARTIASTCRLIMVSTIFISPAISVSAGGPSQMISTWCALPLFTAPAWTLSQKRSPVALGITATVVLCVRLQVELKTAIARSRGVQARVETRRSMWNLIVDQCDGNTVIAYLEERNATWTCRPGPYGREYGAPATKRWTQMHRFRSEP